MLTEKVIDTAFKKLSPSPHNRTKLKPNIQSPEALAKRAEARAAATKARCQKAKSQFESLNSRIQSIQGHQDNNIQQEAAAEKAEIEAHMADNMAKLAEIESRRAITKAEAYEHKARVEANKAEECARHAATKAELIAKLMVSKAELEVKSEKAKAKKIQAKNGDGEQEDAIKGRKETHKARCEYKKAETLLQNAEAAAAAKIKHINAASESESAAKIYRALAKDRAEEAAARKAEAKARRSEAKARRAGDIIKADAKKAEALSKKAEALAIKAEIDLLRLKKRAQASTQAKEALKHPKPTADSLPEKRARYTEKKHLSQPGLLDRVREVFLRVPDRQSTKGSHPLVSICDCLMSGLAMFSLKYPSLLQFENDAQEGGPIHHNLKTLFKVQKVPSDTRLRERLDVIDPELIRPAFKELFSVLQRGKELEQYVFYENYYLLAGDGTEYFSSKVINCDCCCKKEHQDGSVTFYHQMMSAAIVLPGHNTVIPLCPEPVIKSDGSTKNDCEKNAAERLYRHIRREHPHLKIIFTEDALGANGPNIKALKELDMRFIIVIKEDGNKFIFEYLNNVEKEECNYSDEKFNYKLQFYNGVPLNNTHPDLLVNFIEAWVYDGEGNLEYHNIWITDIVLTKKNAYRIYQGGRARWKIENETFNTLKNQGFNLEHNYGHGKQNLSTILALLTMLAFFMDQIQQSCCGLFQAAWEKMKTKVRLWGRMRAYFATSYIDSWEQLWLAIIHGHARSLSDHPDTS